VPPWFPDLAGATRREGEGNSILGSWRWLDYRTPASEEQAAEFSATMWRFAKDEVRESLRSHAKLGRPPWEAERFQFCSSVNPRLLVAGRDRAVPASSDATTAWLLRDRRPTEPDAGECRRLLDAYAQEDLMLAERLMKRALLLSGEPAHSRPNVLACIGIGDRLYVAERGDVPDLASALEHLQTELATPESELLQRALSR
jgi:hypothetical protein